MSDTEMAEDANNQGETSHDESGSLMTQELDAKFEGRFQQLESLIRSLAGTKHNREDSDDVPSGRAHVGGKRAKTGPPATRAEPQQADDSSDILSLMSVMRNYVPSLSVGSEYIC